MTIGDKIEFFEVLACELVTKSQAHWLKEYGTVRADQLKQATRKREIVIARQLCMHYMVEVEGKAQRIAASKYNKDHATVIHAIKTINNLMDTDPIWKREVMSFWQQCKEIKDMREMENSDYNIGKLIEDANYGQHRNLVHSAVGNMFYLIGELYQYLQFKENIPTVQKLIQDCKKSVNELEDFFGYGN